MISQSDSTFIQSIFRLNKYSFRFSGSVNSHVHTLTFATFNKNNLDTMKVRKYSERKSIAFIYEVAHIFKLLNNESYYKSALSNVSLFLMQVRHTNPVVPGRRRRVPLQQPRAGWLAKHGCQIVRILHHFCKTPALWTLPVVCLSPLPV